MKVFLARTSGFCMGVRRAVEMVLDAPGKHK
ncbi:MAG: 4-hydroxy-3-methylbut-2-enyl diphosphate reductase, partial [Deltaproteobacteria bacterium]|nr:4-hydroxy-3-methylbut-2-enyl diphosphate reductase [Deltaproteobacteria bacterium]